MATATPTRRPTATVLTDRRARLQSSIFRRLDIGMVGSAVAISLLGIVMVYSATRTGLGARLGDPWYFATRQTIWVALGLAAGFITFLIDYRRLREWALGIYVLTLFVLAAVLTPLGASAKGSQARFSLGSFQLQPSEFVKLALILVLAAYCAQHRDDLGLRHLIVALGIAGASFALVMLQPDLGTALVLGAITIGILAAAGVKGRYLLALVLIGVVLAVGSVKLGVLKPYQVDRLTAFVDQGGDSKESTYNLEQSKAAIANGGLTGQGLFQGTQTRLGYVPEQHTDFIFTVVGEELGFAGAAVLLGLYALMIWRIWRAAVLSRDAFGTLCCIGVVAIFVFQIFENVGMTMGIMPITGIPLPFMSYGGSSVIISFIAIGLAANVHTRRFT